MNAEYAEGMVCSNFASQAHEEAKQGQQSRSAQTAHWETPFSVNPDAVELASRIGLASTKPHRKAIKKARRVIIPPDDSGGATRAPLKDCGTRELFLGCL
jgi:hypothetical protein